jgi:peroxin-5
MSFLGGAECSTAANPLSQFTKHVQDDKSLQRDRLVGRGPGGLQGMRSTGMNGSQDNVSGVCYCTCVNAWVGAAWLTYDR